MPQEAVNVEKVGSFGMSATDALQKIWQILFSARNGAFPLNTSSGGLELPAYDYQAFTYIGATNNIDTIVYKTGGASGTTVATLTFTYVGAGAADDDDIATITLT